MKKALTGIIPAVLLLAVLITSAFAAGPGRGRNYVDANGDGVCDLCAGNAVGCAAGTGCGRYYVDADGDGVCDLRAGTGVGQDTDAGQGGLSGGFRGGGVGQGYSGGRTSG